MNFDAIIDVLLAPKVLKSYFLHKMSSMKLNATPAEYNLTKYSVLMSPLKRLKSPRKVAS